MKRLKIPKAPAAADRGAPKLVRDYSWLESAASISGSLKTSERKAKRSMLALAAAMTAIFLLSVYASRGESLEELLLRPETGSRSVSLDIGMSYEGESMAGSVQIDIYPAGYGPPEEQAADPDDPKTKLQSVMYRLPSVLASDSSGRSLSLPAELDGVRLSWSAPSSGPAYWLIAAAPALAAALWYSRDAALKRKLEEQKRGVEDELPSMVMQLSLMMNAGLVLSAAFAEILRQNEASVTPMARLLRRVDEESRAGNENFVNVLYRYALASGIKDLSRFAGMMAEQQGRGSELAEKLEKERQQLWSARLSSARGRSKIAETKLSFPLMLVLLSLVLISVGPALMEL